jgi:hypothetical protein
LAQGSSDEDHLIDFSLGSSDEEPSEFHIFIKTLQNTTVTVANVTAMDTIDNIKARLQDGEGFLSDSYQLIFAGKYCEGGETLQYYNIRVESTLWMISGLAGGVATKPKRSSLKQKDKLAVTKSRYQTAASMVPAKDIDYGKILEECHVLCQKLSTDTSGNMIQASVKKMTRSKAKELLDFLGSKLMNEHNFHKSAEYLFPILSQLNDAKDVLEKVLAATEAAFVHQMTVCYYNDACRYDHSAFYTDVEAASTASSSVLDEARIRAELEARIRAELMAEMSAKSARRSRDGDDDVDM